MIFITGKYKGNNKNVRKREQSSNNYGGQGTASHMLEGETS
jgi:hypothetical protein